MCALQANLWPYFTSLWSTNGCVLVCKFNACMSSGHHLSFLMLCNQGIFSKPGLSVTTGLICQKLNDIIKPDGERHLTLSSNEQHIFALKSQEKDWIGSKQIKTYKSYAVTVQNHLQITTTNFIWAILLWDTVTRRSMVTLATTKHLWLTQQQESSNFHSDRQSCRKKINKFMQE